MNLRKIVKYVPEWLPAVLLMLLVTGAFGSSGFAQTVRRFLSPDGRAGVTYFSSAKPGEEDIYVIKLKKGESCQVGLEWQVKEVADDAQGDSRFTIIHPDGRKITDSPDVHIHASVAGDYRIVVSPNATKANYRYRITFIQL